MQDKTINFYMTEKNLKEVIVTKVRNQAKTKKIHHIFSTENKF